MVDSTHSQEEEVDNPAVVEHSLLVGGSLAEEGSQPVGILAAAVEDSLEPEEEGSQLVGFPAAEVDILTSLN